MVVVYYYSSSSSSSSSSKSSSSSSSSNSYLIFVLLNIYTVYLVHTNTYANVPTYSLCRSRATRPAEETTRVDLDRCIPLGTTLGSRPAKTVTLFSYIYICMLCKHY